MPISIKKPTNSKQKRESLQSQISALEAFVVKDPEVFWTEEERLGGGLSKIDAAISMAQASKMELEERLRAKEYEDPQRWHPGENAEDVRKGWESQVEEQAKDIEKFQAQKELVSQQIARLEKLQKTPLRNLKMFGVSVDTPRETISAFQKVVQKELEKSPHKAEVLNEILIKLDSAKTAIDSNLPFKPIAVYLNKSEAKMIQDIVKPLDKKNNKTLWDGMKLLLSSNRNKLTKLGNLINQSLMKMGIPIKLFRLKSEDIINQTIHTAVSTGVAKNLETQFKPPPQKTPTSPVPSEPPVPSQTSVNPPTFKAPNVPTEKKEILSELTSRRAAIVNGFQKARTQIEPGNSQSTKNEATQPEPPRSSGRKLGK